MPESEHVTHLRFVGGTIYCSVHGGRLNLGPEHRIYDAFTCPACGADVPSRKLVPENDGKAA
jgi:hypothetical protein